ncbi:metallophosphoesterase [bacterium]|nr:metallophosphoesterase [bacterium]
MSVTRRQMLGASAAIAAASSLPSFAGAQDGPRKPVLTIAHLTDIHAQPEKHGFDGMIAALAHAQSHPSKPDIIFNGGDAIFDSLAVSHDRTKMLWDRWQQVMKDNCSLPVVHTIGNHDIFGWAKAKSGATGNEPDYGKKWAQEVLSLPKPYYSFDRAGWHFIVLDSVQPNGKEVSPVYTPYLDEEQFAWLEADLAATNPETPVLVFSHVPILSACTFYWGKGPNEAGEWPLLKFLVHQDPRRIKGLFVKHPNVKVALSGHLHLVEEVKYADVTYYCNGAVCGDWWNGPHHEWDPGYAIVRLYADGTSDREYVSWGWTKQDS